MVAQSGANKIEIKPAIVEDHIQLTDLTLRSKASWGYSELQMESWREMLTISPGYIRSNNVFVAYCELELAGYYSWVHTSDNSVELDNMFVTPEQMGLGIGKRLMRDFLRRMQKTGTKEVTLYSDPNAEPFYALFGFVVIGKSESTIKGRYLPVMKKEMP